MVVSNVGRVVDSLFHIDMIVRNSGPGTGKNSIVYPTNKYLFIVTFDIRPINPEKYPEELQLELENIK